MCIQEAGGFEVWLIISQAMQIMVKSEFEME